MEITSIRMQIPLPDIKKNATLSLKVYFTSN